MPRSNSTITVSQIKREPGQSTSARRMPSVTAAAARSAGPVAASSAAVVATRAATTSARAATAAVSPTVGSRRSIRIRMSESEGSLSGATAEMGRNDETIHMTITANANANANATASSSTTRPAITPVVGSKRPASAMDPSTDSGDVTSVKLVGFQAELDRLQEKRRKIKMKHRTERAVYEDLERKVETEETALEQAKHALERAMAEKTEQRHKISQIHRGFAEIDVQTAELTKLKDAYEKYEKRARTQ